MAKTSGSGAVDTKMAVFAGLLSDASPKEAKYLIRTVTGNLRLGIADMTVLEALAIAYGGGKEKPEKTLNVLTTFALTWQGFRNSCPRWTRSCSEDAGDGF